MANISVTLTSEISFTISATLGGTPTTIISAVHADLSTIIIPPPATSTSTAPPSGIPNGEAAGISVATFTFGLVLALLGFWFFMNRRKHSAYDTHGNQSGKSHHTSGHHYGDKQENAQSHEESLLDPVDDSTLKNTMAKLSDFIDQHVLSHYHEEVIEISQNQLAKAINDCKDKNPTDGILADELARLLMARATRLNTIRHFIAWIILSHTGLDSPPDACLLPRYIVTFYNAFPPIERQAGCEEAFETAIVKWKHLSAFLLVPNRSFREDPKVDESQIRSAIDVNLKILHHVLAPFMIDRSNNNVDWEKNLRAIIFSGGELGLILFSQQSNWIFDWKQHSTSNEATMVVFPALLEKVEGRNRLRIVSEVIVA